MKSKRTLAHQCMSTRRPKACKELLTDFVLGCDKGLFMGSQRVVNQGQIFGASSAVSCRSQAVVIADLGRRYFNVMDRIMDVDDFVQK